VGGFGQRLKTAGHAWALVRPWLALGSHFSSPSHKCV